MQQMGLQNQSGTFVRTNKYIILFFQLMDGKGIMIISSWSLNIRIYACE